jgi:serine/threonine-protein kinase
MSDPIVGRMLAERYLVERLIGEGGMGSVYAARQLGLDREVAIKVLRPEVAAGRVEAERFRREALAAARLDHPNIVKVYDFGHAPDGSAFLVMEMLTGPTLGEWLRASPRPDPAAVVAYLEPVCAAVDALHAAGIVHRDIKPANVSLPDSADPDDVVKLIDLGIARFADAARGELTGQLIIGTAEYIAPEVATGAAAGPASDLYALGIMAFEALVGMPPFTGDTDREILVKHIGAPPPLATLARSDLPVGFDDVLSRALAKDAASRYASARELARAMRAALSTPAAVRATARRRAARSILLVEGDADVRAFARDCLAAFGYEVVEATDGVEAFLKLGATPFDLVIADANLSGLDGVSLLRLKTEKGIQTPAILLTADGRLPEGVTAESHGVAAAVALPLDAGALFGAVGAAFGM